MTLVRFDQDEPNVEGFYHFKTKAQESQPKIKGAIDQFIRNKNKGNEKDDVNNEEMQIAQQNNNSLFQKQQQENPDDYNMKSMINVIEYNQDKTESLSDNQEQINQIEIELPKKKSTKTVKQMKESEEKVQNSLRRPRVVKNALLGQEIFCSEDLNAFTRQQFKEYVQLQGGKVISKRNGTSIVVYNVIQPRQQELERIQQEDEFYQFLIRKQIEQFTKEFNGILRKNYRYIRDPQDIKEFMNNLDQLPYPECMKVLTLGKVNNMIKQRLQNQGIVDQNGKFVDEEKQKNNQPDNVSTTQDIMSSPSPNYVPLNQPEGEKNNQETEIESTKHLTDTPQKEKTQIKKVQEQSNNYPNNIMKGESKDVQDVSPKIQNELVSNNIEDQKTTQQENTIQQEQQVQQQAIKKVKDDNKEYVDVWKLLDDVKPVDEFDGRFSYNGQGKFIEKLNQSIAQRELFILSGPVGCGKTLLLEVLLKKHNYNVVIAWDASAAITRFKGGTLFQGSSPTAVILRNIQHCTDLSVILKAFNTPYTGKNYIIFTCDNVYNQKLKTIKQRLKEIKMPQLDTENAIIITSKMLRNSFKNYPPAQQVEKLAKKLAELYNQDIRECLLQFCFQLFSQQFNQSQELFTTPTLFEIVDNIFAAKNPLDMMQNYYIDPMMIHAFLIQNYFKMVMAGKMQIVMMRYLSDALSDADVEQYRMYKLSEWGGFPMAQQSVMQIAVAKPHLDKKSRIDFPSQVLQLTSQPQEYWYNDDQLLSPYENITATELCLNVLDASFYLGLDPNSEEDQNLHMGFGSSFPSIIKQFNLKYCIGSKKTQLIQFVNANMEVDETQLNKKCQKKR